MSQVHAPRSAPPKFPPGQQGYPQSTAFGPPGLENPRPHVPEDVLSYISQRVQQATGHAELQVCAELRRMEASFAALADKVRRVEARLKEQKEAKREAVTQEDLGRLLANVEQRREQDLLSLKRDLRQTIIVHNHNADLMADHKAAIDAIYGTFEEPSAEDRPTLAQTHRKQMYDHLAQIAATLEASGQDVNGLLERGEVILQGVSKMLAASAASLYHRQPSRPPGHLGGHPRPAMPPYGHPEAYLGPQDMIVHMPHYPGYPPVHAPLPGPHHHFAPPMHYPAPHNLMMR
mmetsp:Transcript_62248/g.145973  ORF Transcript_62248/g.145973 Transcript_62248/m.145973 type:complete len:290 (-) Transcript_62248:44-913(-)